MSVTWTDRARSLGESLGLHALLAEHLAEEWADPDTGSAGHRVHVGIETDRGPWVAALLAAGYRVFEINPMSAARYRERHSTSGAKSDAGDAHVEGLLGRAVEADDVLGAHRVRPGDVLIAIPRRDQLFIFDDNGSAKIRAGVRRLIKVTFEDDFNLLSPRLYARRKGRIVTVPD